MKASNKRMIEYVRHKASSDMEFALRALFQIYSYQTDVEKDTDGLISDVRNGVGFSLFDRELLTSFAQQVKRGRHLTWRQMDVLQRRMKKYARQIVALSPMDKILCDMRADGWLDVAGEVVS